MEAVTPIRSVEQFHLLFLAQLSRRVDKKLFVVKGGCNLRFFHRSIRYSEDMDLDLGGVDTHVFRDKVREKKQTETTQRWKLGLRIEGAVVRLPTKIEFSRRGLDEGVAFGSVD